jgi:hypothetical protein
MEQTYQLAGFFAAHAVWCVSDGGALIPLLAYERQDGKREMARLAADRLEEGVEQGRGWLVENPEGVARAVLIYDAYVKLEAGKTDALVIEARRYGNPEIVFTLAIPYRNVEHPEGFAVYRPKLLSHVGGELDSQNLVKAFFRGVDQHEQGAAVWNAHIDQSR